MEVKMGNPDTSGEEKYEIPSLPSGYAIIFRCRDCEARWRLETDMPSLIEVFYKQNRKCYNCNNSNIEMDIVPCSHE